MPGILRPHLQCLPSISRAVISVIHTVFPKVVSLKVAKTVQTVLWPIQCTRTCLFLTCIFFKAEVFISTHKYLSDTSAKAANRWATRPYHQPRSLPLAVQAQILLYFLECVATGARFLGKSISNILLWVWNALDIGECVQCPGCW